MKSLQFFIRVQITNTKELVKELEQGFQCLGENRNRIEKRVTNIDKDVIL